VGKFLKSLQKLYLYIVVAVTARVTLVTIDHLKK
jgi:hypothetical protein